MKEVITLTMRLKKQLRIDQVLKINQLAKSYSGNIYLMSNSQNKIDAAKLPTLIAYLLTVKNGQALNFVINGDYPHLKLKDIELICSSTLARKRVHVLQPAIKN